MTTKNMGQPKFWLRILSGCLFIVALLMSSRGNPEVASALGNTYDVSPGGNDRAQGAGYDIGAFELTPANFSLFSATHPNPVEATTTVISYTITLQNNSDTDATGVAITSTIPNRTTYKSGGAFDGTRIVWPGLALTHNSEITVSFQVDVTGVITNGDQLVNTILAGSTQGITGSIPANTITVGLPSSHLPAMFKWSLWRNGPHLRGANVWQRLVVPELDGDEFLGSDAVGPPYTQADFDHMAALGANYVNISHPGLFTETPPYVLDEQVQANLDRLLEMIARADMFAVITFRTGPGRSDFTFYRDGAGDWFDESLLIESVWSDQAAQDAWAEMWRYTARRYHDNPVVVGYDLICEPNAAGALLDIYEPDEFYPQYANTLYDWNQFYPRLVEAIRTTDPDTPILVSGMGWGAVRWLPALIPTDDDRTVYMVHQYEPQDLYTHQEPPATNFYPGQLDLDEDGTIDSFDRDWLDTYLSAVDDFKSLHNVPVAVNEFGVMRWVPDGDVFMDDQLALFEQRGMNHALWVWNPAWEPYAGEVNAFDFRFGPDPDNSAGVANDLMDVISGNWARNTIRPSSFGSRPVMSPAVTYETRPDGALRLTDSPPDASDQNPAFSPDGAHLLFTRFENGYNEGPSAIYLLNPATAAANLLTAAPDSDSVNLPGSSWNSATGRITFSSDREDIDEIWTMAADGSDLVRVTDHTEPDYFIESSYSRDGQWLVFEADPDLSEEQQQGSIWKVRSDGTGLVQLTEGADDRQPNWSPAGDRIVFQRRTPGSEDWDLYTIAPDGSDIQPVTTGPAEDTDASWSPDGRWIVYSSDLGDLPTPAIFIVPAGGGNPSRITHDDSRYDGAPAWSPDGQWIAFESYLGDEDAPAALWLTPVLANTQEIVAPTAELADVANWFYMIDVNLEPEMVEQISDSAYDMVVLDFIPSEAENTDYPMAEVVNQLHQAPHPRLVIAYIDTGQAEEYRTYWQPGWGIGNPEWITGSDPDGWEGNYPVAYWHDEWRDIWLGEDGYLQAILDAGFDGVYLDWVEAYSDENVIAAARRAEVDPRQEMIWWVGDIAEFGRAQDPEFIVIAQNAAELAEDDDYLDIIDAIAQEQVWFDGGADNEPPGDCPLPRTDADVDTEAYRESLSPACQEQYDQFPDSTLHVSSEEYLQALTLAHDKGAIIFTVDYALEPENVVWVYETSRGLGFVPFAGNRALNQYVELYK
jgi:uncharacterized protein (TIGR01370 family)